MIEIKNFNIEDIDTLSIIMKDAFNFDSRMHLNKDDGPEGYDDGSFIKKWFLLDSASPYTIYFNGEIIGSINLFINDKTNENFLGCIFISPKYENLGLGTKVWKMIEKMYPKTKVWKTETPLFSMRNHNFYINKCGFHCVKIDNPKDKENGTYILEKVMSD